MTTISSSYRRAIEFIPNSPRPPSGITCNLLSDIEPAFQAYQMRFVVFPQWDRMGSTAICRQTMQPGMPGDGGRWCVRREGRRRLHPRGSGFSDPQARECDQKHPAEYQLWQ